MEQNYATVTLCRLYLLQQAVYISFGPTNGSNASRMWEEYEDGGHSGRGHCSAQQRELFFNTAAHVVPRPVITAPCALFRLISGIVQIYLRHFFSSSM